jgi:hypothetical protein
MRTNQDRGRRSLALDGYPHVREGMIVKQKFG